MEELDLKLLQEYTIYDIVSIPDERQKQVMRTKYYRYLRSFVVPICQELKEVGIKVQFSKPYGLTIKQMLEELKQICLANNIDWEQKVGSIK